MCTSRGSRINISESINNLAYVFTVQLIDIWWGGTCETYLTSVKTLQNNFVRITLFKNKLYTAFPHYKLLNILPLRHFIFIFKVLKLFYLLTHTIV